MRFDPSRYGAEVEFILALDGGGERLMPLAQGTCSNQKAMAKLKGQSASALFAEGFAPEAALSGLWLYFSCLDESHALSQDLPSAEGSFWHGIMHRQEPDPGNAGYWFRRVGAHPIFPALAQEARELASHHDPARFRLKDQWDPFAFIDYCEMSRQQPGSADEQLALAIQRLEWQLLFDYCAKTRPHAS